MDGDISHWQSLIITPGETPGEPGADPLTGFAHRLADVLPALRGAAPDWSRTFADDLRANAEMLVRRVILPALTSFATPSATATPRLLLVVDQLEQLFSGQAWGEADRMTFAGLLEALAASGKVWVLATLRADFLGTVQKLPSLVRLRSGGGQADLLPPEVAALRRLITEPARLAGLSFEEREGKSLADTILQDATGHRELLPLTGHLLAGLFHHRTADGVLTFSRYEAVGGVSGALAKHADATFASRALDDEARAGLGRVLHRLVTVSGDDDSTFVRQYPALDSFTPAQRRMVDVFVTGRLFTARQDGSVTLSHEALLRVWPPAKSWIEANADFLRTRARIESRRRQGSLLLEGDPLLELARAHLARDAEGFTEIQRDYIQGSIRLADTARRRRERLRRRPAAAADGADQSVAGGPCLVERLEARRLCRQSGRCGGTAPALF